MGPKPRLLEVDADGKVLVTVPLQPDSDNAHMQTRMARKLPNGNYLVPHLLAFAVKEYQPDGEGRARRSAPISKNSAGGAAENWPFTAIRLENGNTLVNLTHGNKTVEFDADGKVVWRVDNRDVATASPTPAADSGCQAATRSSAATANAKRTWPRRSKSPATRQVVWEYINPNLTGIHEIHVLDDQRRAGGVAANEVNASWRERASVSSLNVRATKNCAFVAYPHSPTRATRADSCQWPDQISLSIEELAEIC